MIPDSFIKELVANTDIVDLISEYVKLKRSGRNHLGLCPFHNEKTPSFSVNSEKGFFHCFGCGIGGDVITFIRQIESMEYVEAVKFLADRAGMKVPESVPSKYTDLMAKQNLRTLEMNRAAAKYFYDCLIDDIGENARNYLVTRGLDMKLATRFGLGFAPGNIRPLYKHLENMGYSNEEMVLANLAVRKDNGELFDRFYNRLIFPIIDKRGNVVAFGGRTLNDGNPKYLNSSDTNVYKKSENLYAINVARTTCCDSFILAEGYMDVIALHAAGFTNTVASLGTALTPQQAKLISRYAKEVIIAYDSDDAGKKAATRAIPILREAGLVVRVLNLGEFKDPDEYIKSHKDGAIRFKKLLEDSQNDIEYMLKKLKEPYDLDLNADKVEYLKKAMLLLSKLDNKIEREIYASHLSNEVQVDKHILLIQIENLVEEEEKKNESTVELPQESQVMKNLTLINS